VGDVFVTGGSGFVGGALVERLVAEGRFVKALARSEAAAEIVRAMGAQPVRGDLDDPTALLEGMRGVRTVFHAAGINAMCQRDPGPMLHANVEGSAAVVRAASAAKVSRVVHTSSAATIGEATGVIGREDTPHRGSFLSQYERSKLLAERKVLALGSELGVPVVCVNPSSVQGPGRVGGSSRLLLDLVNGRLPVLVDTYVPIVDVDDCTEAHLLAELHGAPGERGDRTAAEGLRPAGPGTVRAARGGVRRGHGGGRRGGPGGQGIHRLPRDASHPAARPSLRWIAGAPRARSALHPPGDDRPPHPGLVRRTRPGAGAATAEPGPRDRRVGLRFGHDMRPRPSKEHRT